MKPPLIIRELRILPLAIPMRVKFEHAAASREVADPIIVRLTAGAPYASAVGHGETLARVYVTGETTASVIADIQRVFAPLLVDFHPRSFTEALAFIEQLPFEAEGRVLCAARAAVELALIDLAGRAFSRRASQVAGWLELPGFGAPGCLPSARYSGMIIGRSRRKLSWLLRAQRWYGLRDFKIKVAVDGWEDRLRWAHAVLGRAITNGRATLRADANGGWSVSDAVEAMPLLRDCGVSALEQPLPDTQDGDLPWLAEQSECDLIADESLLTLEDGQRLIDDGGVRVFNVRLAKNGGLMPSLRLARLALSKGLDVQLGCLVGETSLLTAAGQAFLEACPRVRFVEGAFGRRLLRSDITARPLTFGRGGRLRPLTGYGFGLRVADTMLEAVAAAPPVVMRL